ncbi:(2Fe-2S)-binding protein, partial [bacterium]|nr:(2Fe-2S)-binding protein [bacterium]
MIAPKTIKLTINGTPCRGPEGRTILEIARAHDIAIPTLCYLKNLTPWGGCRLCICEVAGSPKVVAACSTPAVDGSVVTTNSERLVRLRRQTLELLFSERNHICPICPSNKGDCGLQHQGYLHGIDAISVPYLYPAQPVDLTGRYFGLDHNRCILCTRCVRTCDEIEGVHTLDIHQRGINNHVIVDGLVDFGRSETCTQCGACVASCPTGALFDKQAAFLGQLTKCEQVRTTCNECPVGCGLIAHVRDGRVVNVLGDPDSPFSRGHLCVRGRYHTWAEPRRRITQPLVRRNGELMPVDWDAALAHLGRLRTEIPDFERGLLASPRLTRETFQVLEQVKDEFSRAAVLVAPNEAALCQAALNAPGELGDLDDADAVIVLGAQPSRDNGVVAARIRVAARKRGAKLIVLGCRKSDLDYYAHIVAHEVG